MCEHKRFGPKVYVCTEFFGEPLSIHKTKGGHGIGSHVPGFLSLFLSRLRNVGEQVDYASFPVENFFSFFFLVWRNSVSAMMDKKRNKT